MFRWNIQYTNSTWLHDVYDNFWIELACKTLEKMLKNVRLLAEILGFFFLNSIVFSRNFLLCLMVTFLDKFLQICGKIHIWNNPTTTVSSNFFSDCGKFFKKLIQEILEKFFQSLLQVFVQVILQNFVHAFLSDFPRILQ